jgi:hypothetical protein
MTEYISEVCISEEEEEYIRETKYVNIILNDDINDTKYSDNKLEEDIAIHTLERKINNKQCYLGCCILLFCPIALPIYCIYNYRKQLKEIEKKRKYEKDRIEEYDKIIKSEEFRKYKKYLNRCRSIDYEIYCLNSHISRLEKSIEFNIKNIDIDKFRLEILKEKLNTTILKKNMDTEIEQN